MAPSSPIDRVTALSDPGFTPGASQLPELFALLARTARDDAPRIERVIARAGDRALAFAIAEFSRTSGEARARVVGVLGRLADPRADETLRTALCDPEPRVRRRAASALGRSPASAANESALIAAFEGADLSEQRAIVEALGKVGGTLAQGLLSRVGARDVELTRRLGKALLFLERRLTRDREAGVAVGKRLERPLTIVFRSRPGLARYVAEELSALGAPRLLGPQRVELEFAGSWRELFRARSALEWGVRLPLAARTPEALPAAVAEALAGDDAGVALSALCEGGLRYRLELASGGHQRARVLQIVQRVAARLPDYVNDPRHASFVVVVVDDADDPHLVLVPKAFDDERFAYRRRDVRAASHPTVAAALARAAGVRDDDRVWDPFVGSGLELVERALLGPAARLVGTDLDPEALAAARENLDSAGVRAELELADATLYEPGAVTLILTNPPMGRRLARDRSLGPLLERFLNRAATVLAPGGRLVWLSPLPRETRAVGHRLALELSAGHAVDLGGFEVELQIFSKNTKHRR